MASPVSEHTGLSKQESTKQEAPGRGDHDAREPVARSGNVNHAVEQRAQEAMQRGDHKAALTLLMNAYGDDIYRFCRQFTGDAQLAEDLRQVVFIQAYEELPGAVPRSTLRAWLYGVARHRCLDACKGRTRWRKRFQLSEAMPEPANTDAPDPSDAIDQPVLAAALTHCLEKLDLEQRMLILMRCRDGLSYSELSETFRTAPATLQARVVRALPALRRCVQGQGVLP
jgi:RNA polymerase sigma-70 factor (ECF subfamily)